MAGESPPEENEVRGTKLTRRLGSISLRLGIYLLIAALCSGFQPNNMELLLILPPIGSRLQIGIQPPNLESERSLAKCYCDMLHNWLGFSYATTAEYYETPLAIIHTSYPYISSYILKSISHRCMYFQDYRLIMMEYIFV